MTFCIIDPLADPRWDEFVARHPRASAFHARGWLESLYRTYGYQPQVLTSSALGLPLSDGFVFCRVASWISGNRIVSLPFSDHCDPLLSEGIDFACVLEALRSTNVDRDARYVEVRPLLPVAEEISWLRLSNSYCFHTLDLSPSSGALFGALHKDSIQRKIRRAEREQLSYEAGNSPKLLAEFYRLMLITRRRHQLLPQPRAWFQNLAEGFGDTMQVRVARKDGHPVAAMLNLRHGSSVIYKYGCSDERFHNLGGMPFLFWRLIEECKAAGLAEIDFGRSDSDHRGLMTFKERFGARRNELRYYRHNSREVKAGVPGLKALRHFVPMLPDSILCGAGALLYRHMG